MVQLRPDPISAPLGTHDGRGATKSEAKRMLLVVAVFTRRALDCEAVGRLGKHALNIEYHAVTL